MKLIWTAFAAGQLENIYRFLNTKNETAAVMVYNEILDEQSLCCILQKWHLLNLC